MFKATDFTVEILAAGLLVIASVVCFTLGCVLPPDSLTKLLAIFKDQSTLDLLKELTPFASAAILTSTPLLIALAYGVGVISELASRQILEDLWHKKTKQKSLTNYYRQHHDLLVKSPLLRKYAETDPSKVFIYDADQLIGEMRYYVMLNSDKLYREIDSQINQLRIVRVQFFVLIITCLSILIATVRGVFGSLSTGFLMLVVAGLFLALDTWAVSLRYNRYCRAVQRGYRTLLASSIGQ